VIICFRRVRLQSSTTFSHESIELRTITPIAQIEIKEQLGGGHFGTVYRGVWMGSTEIAAKKMNGDHGEELEKEATMLQSLKHPNIVLFLGIFTESTTKYIITEYLPMGSLDKFLQLKGKDVNLAGLISMATDAAKGLLYLSQRKIIHRDLALRNLLVAGCDDDNYLIKVADFGMSRIIADHDSYYLKHEGLVPIKWSAPEILGFGKFSSQSDSWAYGVVLWELFSYGKNPYPGVANMEIPKLIESGYRLDNPNGCPDNIRELMLSCWSANPADRPDFETIFKKVSIQSDGTKYVAISTKK